MGGNPMTKKPRAVVGVRQDKDGDITHVKLAGNQRVTPLSQAVGMADRGEIKDVHTVQGENKKFLRSDRDGSVGNNLDEKPKV